MVFGLFGFVGATDNVVQCTSGGAKNRVIYTPFLICELQVDSRVEQLREVEALVCATKAVLAKIQPQRIRATLVSFLKGLEYMCSEHVFVRKRPNSEEMGERRQIIELVLYGGTSQAPSSACVKTGSRSELLGGWISNPMGCFC